jgi:hypothetical protein
MFLPNIPVKMGLFLQICLSPDIVVQVPFLNMGI